MKSMPPESELWLSEQLKKAASEPNPCVKTFGMGPEGKKCKTCAKLYARKFSKTYYKCALRRETCGPGSDHRLGWNSCAKYEEQK